MNGYTSGHMTLEVSKIVLNLEDPEFVSFQFYYGNRCVANIYTFPKDNKSLKLMDGELQYGNEYTLMEEINVANPAEPTEAS